MNKFPFQFYGTIEHLDGLWHCNMSVPQGITSSMGYALFRQCSGADQDLEIAISKMMSNMLIHTREAMKNAGELP